MPPVLRSLLLALATMLGAAAAQADTIVTYSINSFFNSFGPPPGYGGCWRVMIISARSPSI
jgi:hypothetical protein